MGTSARFLIFLIRIYLKILNNSWINASASDIRGLSVVWNIVFFSIYITHLNNDTGINLKLQKMLFFITLKMNKIRYEVDYDLGTYFGRINELNGQN